MAVGAVGVFGLMLVGALYFYGSWVQDGFRAASDDAERIAGTALNARRARSASHRVRPRRN